MRLALAQINSTVGDLAGNLQKITGFARQAAARGADLICFPELAITGYPPEDLLLKTSFLAAARSSLEKLAGFTRNLEPVIVVGCIDVREGNVYNAAALLHKGSLVDVYHKNYLPNYGVFDEKRYFQSGRGGLVFTCAGVNVGLTICEDIWHPLGPALLETHCGGAEIILNLSASPYHRGKHYQRREMMAVRAADHTCFLAFVNLVGGQDELVFDGNSMIFDEQGRLIGKGASFREDLLFADITTERILRTRLHDIRHRELRAPPDQPQQELRRVFISGRSGRAYPPLKTGKPNREENEQEEAEIYAALVLGVRDYLDKNGFRRAFIGLSGGIDSSLTAAVAVDALGRERITGIFMPSPFTSRESAEDARELAANLDIDFLTIPIEEIFDTYIKILNPACGCRIADITMQNIQARIRGNILMALANQYGGIVLTTGNKSELSVGYATLYGDMAGGFAVLKDLPKTLVYRLARYRNMIAGRDIIPQRVLKKAPTAELRENQKDEDDLPPYSILDQIIEQYVEEDLSLEEMIAAGSDPGQARRIIAMIDGNEYKRRQAPPGVRITPRAFGKDRRMPITCKFHEDYCKS